jgi:beta-glucanase (GH16 family)
MEAGGSDPTSITITMHYHYASSYYAPGWAYTGPNFSQDFHTIGVNVEPNAITWYVDGQQWARFSGAAYLRFDYVRSWQAG